VVSTLARSAYSLGHRAFDMGPDQLAPLGPQYRNELNPGELTRAVAALVLTFDELDLANLSWAYWHACAATPHIAPALFGAAIEALQTAYIKAHPGLDWRPCPGAELHWRCATPDRAGQPQGRRGER
jgi:hypothetical protein